MKYWAFLSYSRQDKIWAGRLHRWLETYRLPLAIPGLNAEAKVRRLHPCFMDREELSAAADLGQVLQEHLEESAALLVICSPASVRSRFVGHEITWFREHHPERPILALIVDGEPNASDDPDSSLEECFPDALRWDRRAEPERLPDPLGADLRPWADGKQAAFLKLAAGLAGLPYADLSRRDHLRRRRRQARWALGGPAALVLASWVVWSWRGAEARSQETRIHQELGGLTGKSPLDLLEVQRVGTGQDEALVLVRKTSVEVREANTGALRWLVALPQPRLLSVADGASTKVWLTYEQAARGAFGLSGTTSVRAVAELDVLTGELRLIPRNGLRADAQILAAGAWGTAALEPASFWEARGNLHLLGVDGHQAQKASLPEPILRGGFDAVGGSPAGALVGPTALWSWSDGRWAKAALPSPPAAGSTCLDLHAWGGLWSQVGGGLQLLHVNGSNPSPGSLHAPGTPQTFERALRQDRIWCLMDARQRIWYLDRTTGVVQEGTSVERIHALDPLLAKALEGSTVIARAEGAWLWVVYLAETEGYLWRVDRENDRLERWTLPPSALAELSKASLATFGGTGSRLVTVLGATSDRSADADPFGDLSVQGLADGTGAWILCRDRMLRLDLRKPDQIRPESRMPR